MTEQRTRLAAIAAFVALCIIWSSTWLAIKLGLRDLPPISFVALRFIIAVVVLLAISVGRVPLLPRNRGDFKLLAWTGVLMFAINYALLFWAELYVSSGLSAVLQATIPIFGMVFAHYIIPSEPLRAPRIAGAVVAIGGVAVICSRLLDFGGLLAFWGGVAIVFGAAGAAFSNVLLKARAIRLAPAMIAAWQMIFGLAPLIVIGFFVEGNPLHFHWTGRAILCLFYLAIPGSAFAFLLLYWLMPRMSVTNLQTISFITPPGAVLFGWLLGGESFSLWSLAGGALVLAGVWMIFRKAKPAELEECETALPQG
jgi:drug/metabolite transporter (DMT)-like permease